MLFERATALAGAGEVLIQDIVPGDGTHQFAYCAFFKEGHAIGSMEARRRRQHPHEFGRASTFVETIDLPALGALSERFLHAIDYYGLVEVEFKLDPRDGQFKLLDVNARTWGYHTLGPSAGVDFPYLLYRDQTGTTVDPCRGKSGVSWIRLLTDIPTGIIEVGRRRLKFSEYLRSLRGFNTEAVFSWEHPMPGIVECALVPLSRCQARILKSIPSAEPVAAQSGASHSTPIAMQEKTTTKTDWYGHTWGKMFYLSGGVLQWSWQF